MRPFNLAAFRLTTQQATCATSPMKSETGYTGEVCLWKEEQHHHAGLTFLKDLGHNVICVIGMVAHYVMPVGL